MITLSMLSSINCLRPCSSEWEPRINHSPLSGPHMYFLHFFLRTKCCLFHLLPSTLPIPYLLPRFQFCSLSDFPPHSSASTKAVTFTVFLSMAGHFFLLLTLSCWRRRRRQWGSQPFSIERSIIPSALPIPTERPLPPKTIHNHNPITIQNSRFTIQNSPLTIHNPFTIPSARPIWYRELLPSKTIHNPLQPVWSDQICQ